MLPAFSFYRSLAHISGLLLLLGTNACAVFNATPAYVPQTANLPLLRQGGQADLGVSYGPTGAEGQVAVALSSHLAVTGQAQVYNADKGRDRFRNLEVGFGTYRWLPLGLLLGLYGGAGSGAGRATGYTTRYNLFYSDADSTGRRARARYTSAYVLPMLGWRSEDQRTEGALGLKASAVHYQKLQFDEVNFVRRYDSLGLGSLDLRETSASYRDYGGSTRIHLQLTGLLSVLVMPHVRANLRLGWDVNPLPRHKSLEARSAIATLGLSFRLGKDLGPGAPQP